MADALDARLRKRLARFELAAELSFQPGVTALLGPSGAGKTTMIRCLAGLARPDEGTIRLGGACWFDGRAGLCLPVQARRVGFVFDDAALFPHLTVLENAAFGADRARAEAMLARMRVADLAAHYPRSLSAGQRQRVALARSFASAPQALFLDEPFSSLDAPLKEELHAEFVELATLSGVPTLLVTHDLEEATRLASRLVLLEAGRVLQAGPTREVLLAPESAAAARLLGMRNCFTGEALPPHGLKWGDRLLSLAQPLTAAGPLGFCVRAELLRLGAEEGPNRLEGHVREVTLLGPQLRVRVAIPGAGDLEAFVPFSSALPSVGQAIAIAVPPEALRVFPA